MRGEARDLKDAARRTAQETAGQLKDAAQGATEQARQAAVNLTQQAREKGTAFLDQQRQRAAEVVGDCVAATRRAAQKLHDENDHNLAGYADAVAERMDSVGRYLREQDSGRMIHDAADLARRRPEWVLGGAFVAGLAIARFLKATRPEGAAYGSYRYGESSGPGGDYRYGDYLAAGGRSSYGNAYDDRSYASGASGASGTGGSGFDTGTTGAGSTLFTATPGTFGAATSAGSAGESGSTADIGSTVPVPAAPTLGTTGTASVPLGVTTMADAIGATRQTESQRTAPDVVRPLTPKSPIDDREVH